MISNFHFLKFNIEKNLIQLSLFDSVRRKVRLWSSEFCFSLNKELIGFFIWRASIRNILFKIAAALPPALSDSQVVGVYVLYSTADRARRGWVGKCLEDAGGCCPFSY